MTENLTEIEKQKNPTGINKQALQDAYNIDQYIKQNGFPSGTLISKSSLKLKFDLAHTRSALVFQYLKQKGYGIEIRNIRVP